MPNVKYISINGENYNREIADSGPSVQVYYQNKEEKNHQRLLNEKKELQRKKLIIEFRLKEIQENLNERREEIRRGNR